MLEIKIFLASENMTFPGFDPGMVVWSVGITIHNGSRQFLITLFVHDDPFYIDAQVMCDRASCRQLATAEIRLGITRIPRTLRPLVEFPAMATMVPL